MQKGHITEKVYPKQIERKKYMQKSLNEGGKKCEENLMNRKFIQRYLMKGTYISKIWKWNKVCKIVQEKYMPKTFKEGETQRGKRGFSWSECDKRKGQSEGENVGQKASVKDNPCVKKCMMDHMGSNGEMIYNVFIAVDKEPAQQVQPNITGLYIYKEESTCPNLKSFIQHRRQPAK